jgi:hypothetical protein
LPGKRPEDDIIEAKLVDDAEPAPSRETQPLAQDRPLHEEPPMHDGQPMRAERPWQTSYSLPRRSSALAPVLVVVGLLVVTALAVAFRVELVDIYETIVLGLSDDGPTPEREVPAEAGVPTERDPLVETETERVVATPVPPDVELPTFEKIERPDTPLTPAPDIPDLVDRPPDEKVPGYGYSRIENRDLSAGDVVKYRVKVVVPAHYSKADLLRVAADLVRRQRITRPAHAMRVLFFTDPTKTADGDASAEIVWAPGGAFDRAAEAAREGTDDNQYRIDIRN